MLIPLLDTADGAAGTARAEPGRLDLLLASGQRSYTRLGVRWADARSQAWAARNTTPYGDEIARVAQTIGRAGAYLLNYSYEWGCTTGAVPEPGGGMTLMRTLDWPFDGLGRALIVLRSHTPLGGYYSVTWPGYAGVLTALAPGRFAAAINQPPLPLPGWGRAAGWLAARVRVGRSTALPPSHALRLACETCATFAEAEALLRTTPLCLPAIFTLAGCDDDAVVIERTATAAYSPADPFAANHWQAGPPGRPRNATSHARRTAMGMTAPDWSLAWLRPPILVADTRVVVMAHPRSGRMVVQGWEKDGPVTDVLDVRPTTPSPSPGTT